MSRNIPRTNHLEEEGQAMAEYAVVLTVVAVATVGVFTAVATHLNGIVNFVAGLL